VRDLLLFLKDPGWMVRCSYMQCTVQCSHHNAIFCFQLLLVKR